MKNKLLILMCMVLISLSFVSATYYNSLDTDLRAYYSFDVDYSDDFSTYDLAVPNYVTFVLSPEIVEGKINNCVNYTRYMDEWEMDNYKTLLESPNMGDLSTETICFWIQYNDTDETMMPFGRREQDAHHYFWTNLADGYSGVSGGGGSAGVIDEHNIMNTDWHFVCVGGSSEQTFIYVDGNYNINIEDALTSNSNPIFWVGSYGGYTTNSLQGRLDELGFWGRELSQAEMDILYNSGSGFSYFQEEVINEEPYFTSLNPAENYDTETGIVNFEIQGHDDTEITEMYLFIDGETVEYIEIGSTDGELITQKTLSNGSHTWYAQINDEFYAITSETRNIIVNIPEEPQQQNTLLGSLMFWKFDKLEQSPITGDVIDEDKNFSFSNFFSNIWNWIRGLFR